MKEQHTPPIFWAYYGADGFFASGKGEPDFSNILALSVLDAVRRAVCAVGVVGQIDGHDVIRRESAIEMIERAVGALENDKETAA